jgi:uncharacterized membrane protein
MAFDTSSIISKILPWLISPLMWLFIVIFIVGGCALILFIRKKRKLKFPCIEKTEYGWNTLKAGWFGEKNFFKLWDYGQEKMFTQDMEEINQFSEEDFIQVNGSRGIIVYRDPINRFMFPISKCEVRGTALLMNIAPAEYRDTGLKIIDETGKETTDFKEKVLQFIGWALVVIFSLIAIIMIIQFIKWSIENADKRYLEATTLCMENAKIACKAVMDTFALKSGAP